MVQREGSQVNDVLDRWDELWTVRQAAKELRMSPDHLYDLARKDRVPHVRRGREVRFEPEQVRKWDAARTRLVRVVED